MAGKDRLNLLDGLLKQGLQPAGARGKEFGALTPGETARVNVQAAAVGLGTPLGRALTKVGQGELLTQRERDLLKGHAAGLGGNPPLQDAISRGLQEDADRKAQLGMPPAGPPANPGGLPSGLLVPPAVVLPSGGSNVIVTGPGGGTTVIDPGASGVVTQAYYPPAGVEQSTSSTSSAPPAVVQYTRFLKIANATDQKLTVYVQYRALRSDKSWGWYPADPRGSDQALAFEIDPGKETLLTDGDRNVTINGSRIRLWATAQGSEWNEYKDEDLWLVTEEDQEGYRCYYAAETEAFTFRFTP